MRESTDANVSQLIAACADDDASLLARVYPLIYAELKQIAHRALLRASGNATLSTTALVNEAYVKLAAHSSLAVNDRSHLFALCARAMRQIVVDHARRRAAAKRGGALQRVDLDSTHLAVDAQAEEIVALNDALSRLSQLDERLARVVELRFFAGLSVQEAAEVMETSERTVKRDWRKACALLYQAMTDGERS
jgi:RNA polymerase sigma factor (TIGR02999 family)